MDQNRELQQWITAARSRLAALREKKPATKAGQIRALWPDIDAALQNGHTLKTVREWLEAEGVSVTVQSLGSYITRMRRKDAMKDAMKRVVQPAPPYAAGDLHATPAVNAEPVQLKRELEPEKLHDPLANVRARQAKRPGFDYRPELADPAKLI